MSDALPSEQETLPPLSDAIDAACDRFEDAWREAADGKTRPCIEDYLAEVPQAGQTLLLLELILLDQFYRGKAGERVGAEDYLARFPLLSRQRLDRNIRRQEQAAGAAPARTASTPAPGGLAIPGYEVLGVLGEGGMGVAYKARQVALNRVVALKMILHAEHAAADLRERFRIEAQALARLQHPNIVQIHEVGECAGLPYFSLEFCAGGSLADQLDGTPWEPAKAAALVETLARAVDAAHRASIIHRDLKPANVLLLADGTVKVTDFGLAKKLDEKGKTQTGAVMGTPSYMAPEQAGGKGKEVGPAADVYALGAILYELLVGRPPFKAATPLDTMLQVLSEEPVAVRRLQPKVPRDLETICHKCLHKDPRRRYASAEELANDLRRFQAGEPIRARPVGRVERAVKWAKRRPALAVLLGVTLLTLVTLVVLSANLAIARNAAQQEADKAKKARDFLVSIFKLAVTDKKGRNVPVGQILDDAETQIPVQFADQPDLRADLVATIGQVKRGIGRRTPQAMILEVRGVVQVQPAVGKPKVAVPQALLHLDDRLSLSADSQVQLVFLSDWHKERLASGREVTIDYQGCEPGDAVLERDASVLMTFVRLPKGSFYMGWGGAPRREDYLTSTASIMLQGQPFATAALLTYQRAAPARAWKTEIKEDFEIAVHDVTQGQWQAVMGDNPSHFSRKGDGRTEILEVSDEELKLFPVEMVSWDDAQEFLKKLNEKERSSGYLYRLPSEAEWEYACRGGATSLEECSHHFYFDRPTDNLSSRQANFNGNFPFGAAITDSATLAVNTLSLAAQGLSHQAFGAGPAPFLLGVAESVITAPFGKGEKGPFLGRTIRVGAYPPNKLGLCDMHGNVWQWCADLWDPKQGVGSVRVFRGGSWFSYGTSCRAAYRYGDAPTVWAIDLGFRLVRVPRPAAGQANQSERPRSP
jgi:formylglycine-generating enzyme required for sulfatase activity